MATTNAQKLKLLHLMEILRTQTDPERGLTMPQIIQALSERGISAERKSLYADIRALRDFGLDVRTYNRQPVEYALAERDFEFSEIMLLVDAVQSSRFLSEGKSNALVKSIRQLASSREQAALNKQVHVYGRPKTQTQSDFNAVDLLQEAVSLKRKVSFKYFMYNAAKEKVARHNGAAHIVTPIAIIYSEGNYYLAAYSDRNKEIRNYRVDRMGCIELLDDPAERNDEIRAYDVGEVGKCAFGMFGGKRTKVTLKVKTEAMNVIVDRFGKDVTAVPIEEGSASKVTAPVMVSPVFFGWLAQMGNLVRIESPASVQQDFLDFLASIQDSYVD